MPHTGGLKLENGLAGGSTSRHDSLWLLQLLQDDASNLNTSMSWTRGFLRVDEVKRMDVPIVSLWCLAVAAVPDKVTRAYVMSILFIKSTVLKI